MTERTLVELARQIREEGGLLAGVLLAEPRVPPGDPGVGALAASGPRAEHAPEAFALAVEAAYEGYLLHRGSSRVLDASDRDLALLAGDRLYALSLATLAQVGAVDAVRELADVISLGAQGQAEQAPAFEQAAWEATASAIGWGGSPEVEAAKVAARSGAHGAAESLRNAARQLRRDVAHAS